MAIIFDGTQGITTPAETANNSVTTPIVKSSDNLVFQTNGTTEAMRITAAQNVGIGTNNPTAPLQINTAGVNQTVQINSTDASGGYGAVLALNNTGTGGRQYAMHSTSNADGEVGGGKLKFSDVNASASRMIIDSSGRVTKPYQPYCLVGKTNGNVSAQNTILFDQIQVNVGSHYNSGTGRFTAPISGYYYVSLSILGTTSSGIEGSIKKNGSVVVNTRGGGASGYTSASSSSVIYLATNDYLFAYVEGSYTASGDSGYPYTGMTVYLLG
jgi:hypothetical protein